jgi:nicotinamidase-related amidase
MNTKIVAPVVVSIDMHRGHLDADVATMPLPRERSEALVQRAAPIYRALRERGVPIVQVVTRYRTPHESVTNPFWASRRSGTRARAAEHNLFGSPGTQIVPALFDPRDVIVDTKKRYSAYLHTDLEFVLRDLGARTVILTGVNTNSCILCSSFETVNRDFDLIVLRECVDSMDGVEPHHNALRLIETALGRVLAWGELEPMLPNAGWSAPHASTPELVEGSA